MSVWFGVHCEYGNLSNRITNESSIFTAELEAIKSALNWVSISPRSKKKYVIFSDSKSVLESIYSQESKNPIMLEVLDTLQKLRINGFIVKFCWLPSHVGIQGNEAADVSAKSALKNDYSGNYKIPFSDLIPKVKQFNRSKWICQWEKYEREVGCKLYQINPQPNICNHTNTSSFEIRHL